MLLDVFNRFYHLYKCTNRRKGRNKGFEYQLEPVRTGSSTGQFPTGPIQNFQILIRKTEKYKKTP
jgi:hypothetical protein